MNLLLTGGGTGGHVYPALALAEAACRRDPTVRILFAGSRAGMEAVLVPAAGVSFAGLAVRPPRSRAPGRALIALATGAVSLIEAVPLVARFRPDAIVATGGIAAAPVVVVGAVLRVPVIVLEGNVLPGRLNRWLARYSRAVAVAWEATAARLAASPRRGYGAGTRLRRDRTPAGAFPQADARPQAPPGISSPRVTVTGLPVRRDVYTAARGEGFRLFGLDPARRTVLILGGSQGAARLNAAAEEAAARLAGRRDVQVLHQVGRGWGPAAGGREVRETGGARYVRVPYLEPIGPAYACADLVVSRCGAAALAEITACGRPAILVPYPFAAEDHQVHNAAPLVAAGAASLVPDASLGGDVLAREIAAILDTPGRLTRMAAAARALGRPDAAERVLQLIAELCCRRAAAQEAHG